MSSIRQLQNPQDDSDSSAQYAFRSGTLIDTTGPAVRAYPGALVLKWSRTGVSRDGDVHLSRGWAGSGHRIGRQPTQVVAVTDQDRPEEPRLTVLGSLNGAQDAGSLKQSFVDGSAEIAIGAAVASGFGVESAKTLIAGDTAGRWWFLLVCLAGMGLIVFGFWRREQLRRRVHIGIVATAADAAKGLAHARQLESQAETYSRAWPVTVKTGVQLPAGGGTAPELVQSLADQTIEAITLAEQLSPNAVQINLFPTMRLHVAFRYGARLGQTHTRGVMVYEPHHDNGAPSHFPAALLKATDSAGGPLNIDGLETIDGGDPTSTALALDLQARGEAFFAPVRKTCQENGIGNLLRLSSRVSRLPENTETFTGAIEQICRTWFETQLPDGARTGRHAIFLSGPVAIAVALGARLASADHGRWTAYTYDAANNTYERFPPQISI